jgi:hypothetical protein
MSRPKRCHFFFNSSCDQGGELDWTDAGFMVQDRSRDNWGGFGERQGGQGTYSSSNFVLLFSVIKGVKGVSQNTDAEGDESLLYVV